MIAFELSRTQFYQPLFALHGAGMKDSVIVEAASLWLVSAMDVSVKAMLLALLAGVALKLTRIADPNLRHRVWTGILMAMLAMPVLSQLLPSLRLPFAIDSSWLITQQDPSIVEVQAAQTVNAIQAESLAFESGAIASGNTGQMNELKLVEPRGDGGLRVSSERLLRSRLGNQSPAEHERDLATTPFSAESSAAASRSEALNAVKWQSKWIAPILSVILSSTFLLWMVISVIMLARLALALIGSVQLKSSSSSIALSDLSDLDLPPELLNVCGRSLQLFECPRLNVPVTVGVLAPRVYLPCEWLEWTHEKLVAVLTHERTHIERRDCAVILLAEFNRCIFWFHPLAWWLKVQLSALAEAACDDAVIGTTGDRTTYARHLLEVACVVARQRGRVSPIGVSMARCSNVETRIRSILDFTRPLSQKLTNATSIALLLVIVLIVIVAASLQIGGHSNSSQTGTLDSRDEPGPLISGDGEETPSTKANETKKGDARTSITIDGTVLKPNGTPAAGAAVRSYPWWWKWPAQDAWGESFPPLLEATAGSDGRFSLKLPIRPDDRLDDPTWKDVWTEPSWKQIWNYSAVVASMPGYGGSWLSLEQIGEQKSITLQLVEDAPIRGKIIDLEGKPISGVTIRISAPTDGKEGSLDPWLAGIRAGEPPWTVHNKAGTTVEPQLLHIPDKMETDWDGRFEIRGLGRERKINLALIGNSVAHREMVACTRKMEPVSRLILPDTSKQTEPVFGSEFVYSAAPGRIISGTFQDAATGETLAGVRVESYELDGYPFVNHRVLKAVSDSQGRFQLIGMPKGAKNQLIALPPDGMPFLMRTQKVPDPNGLGPIEMQIELNRGVLITGRVTDKETGAGVPDCRLNYFPYRSNPFAQRSPEFGTDEHGQGDQMRYTTDADGRFQLVGLPGKAVIGVVSVFQNFRVGFGYDQLAGPKEGNSDRIDTYRNPINPSPKWPTSMREVDIDADATNYSLDLQLDPGASVRLAIQDLDGKPVAGISAQGLAPNGNGSATHDTAPRAANFGAKETRSIVLRHDKRRIGSVLRIGPEEVKQEQIAVVLEPFATVRGKLMLDAEHAATGAVIKARVLPSEDFSLSLPEVATDNEGRFQMDLMTGCKYYLDVRGNQIGNSSLAKELTIVPGQHIDMGTLVFVEGSFVGPLLRP